MTPRQRWLALLGGKEPDRIPTDYWATPEVTARLFSDLGCRDKEALFRRLGIDACTRLTPPWKRSADPTNDADMWGVRFQTVEYGTGSYEEPVNAPLAEAQSVADIEAHPWPSPDDFDYEAVTRDLERRDDYRLILSGSYEPFLIYGYLRGLAQAFEDLILRPDFADAILAQLFEFHHEYHRRLFTAGRGRIDLTYVAEDLGSQTGPLISLETYRRFLLPNQIKMADLARSFDIHVMYHTDGAARLFLPDLVDRVGIEVLNPIQWRCPGMEREGLVADFGDRIIFHGSIDNQQTLPFGTPQDVVREVQESVDIYEPTRWICGPCHRIQSITPTENVVAMYEAIRSFGA